MVCRVYRLPGEMERSDASLLELNIICLTTLLQSDSQSSSLHAMSDSKTSRTWIPLQCKSNRLLLEVLLRVILRTLPLGEEGKADTAVQVLSEHYIRLYFGGDLKENNNLNHPAVLAPA